MYDNNYHRVMQNSIDAHRTALDELRAKNKDLTTRMNELKKEIAQLEKEQKAPTIGDPSTQSVDLEKLMKDSATSMDKPTPNPKEGHAVHFESIEGLKDMENQIALVLADDLYRKLRKASDLLWDDPRAIELLLDIRFYTKQRLGDPMLCMRVDRLFASYVKGVGFDDLTKWKTELIACIAEYQLIVIDLLEKEFPED